MSGGAIVAIVVGLVVILNLALWLFEVRRPDKRAGVERVMGKVTLVLAAVALAVIPFALSQGRFWAAALLAFNAYVLLSNRRTKQRLARERRRTSPGGP
jgi:hypothetical protein